MPTMMKMMYAIAALGIFEAGILVTLLIQRMTRPQKPEPCLKVRDALHDL